MHPTINIGIGIRIGRQDDDDDDPSKLFGAGSPWSVCQSQSVISSEEGRRSSAAPLGASHRYVINALHRWELEFRDCRFASPSLNNANKLGD